MKLCCSIAPVTMAEALSKLKEAGKQADLVELRIDALTNLNLPLLLKQPRPPVIITNRIVSEGGKFNGSKSEHIKILSEAMQLGAEYIDIEFSCGTKAIQTLKAQSKKTKLIVSYHNFENTPANLVARYENMKRAGADIIKIATMAKDISDNKIIFDLQLRAKKEKQKLIALCMGERGQISRIVQGKYNGFLTYAPLDQDKATAPGQLSVQDLIKTFRVSILQSKTKVFGLIGNPVSHSRGIYFHNQVFAKKHIDAVYVNFLVDNLPRFIESFKDLAQGFSVTMPFKQEILPLLDSVEDTVKELNAVNTIIKQRNKLFGTNTDLLGIVACLKKRVSLKGKRVTILGTGSTARTMAYAAMTNGATVTFVGRNLEKAQQLANTLGCSSVTPDSFSEIPTDILMNATSVGMNSTTDIPFQIQNMIKSTMIVFDAVYAPPVTPLLNVAEQKGCTIISGLELFQTQAKLQSKLFINSI